MQLLIILDFIHDLIPDKEYGSFNVPFQYDTYSVLWMIIQR